jgi:hypothetical protein
MSSTHRPDRRARERVDAYVEHWLDFYPSAATGVGHHESDDRLEDFSPERLAARLDFLGRTGEYRRQMLNEGP